MCIAVDSVPTYVSPSREGSNARDGNNPSTEQMCVAWRDDLHVYDDTTNMCCTDGLLCYCPTPALQRFYSHCRQQAAKQRTCGSLNAAVGMWAT